MLDRILKTYIGIKPKKDIIVYIGLLLNKKRILNTN